MNRRQILTGLGGAALAAGPARAAEKPLWMSPQLPDGTREEATLEALPGKQKLIRLTDRPPNYEAPIETLPHRDHARTISSSSAIIWPAFRRWPISASGRSPSAAMRRSGRSR